LLLKFVSEYNVKKAQENQERLKSNGKRQLPVCANDVI